MTVSAINEAILAMEKRRQLYSAVCIVMMLAILGFVGAGGIGTELRRTIGWGKGSGDETAALFVLLILSIFIIDQTSSFLRRRLITGARAA